jgi:hypothetical protein
LLFERENKIHEQLGTTDDNAQGNFETGKTAAIPAGKTPTLRKP